MAFEQEIKDAVYERAGSQCECMREHIEMSNPPHPGGRCPHSEQQIKFIFWARDGGKPETAESCEMICLACRNQVLKNQAVRSG
jgi:hypothetical protein